MRILCVCVFVSTRTAVWAAFNSFLLFFGNCSDHLDLRRVNVCVFLCVLMHARGNKNRGCPMGSSARLCMNTLSTSEALTHTHVKGLTSLGMRLLSCAVLCSSVRCEADLGKCVLSVCLPSMEFMKELRDQTAADGVCLAAVQALHYPVGQCNWCFLSHQVYNLCRPCCDVPE